ncbi:MAG: amidohydrolase [Elusimicrobia bacterium]|nr:amidohydrolase [Elusimicrobiota bacterium]
MPALLCSLLAASLLAAEPELILAHGRVFIAPGRYAQAVAVVSNRIESVGSDAAVLALKGPATRVVDLRGRAVTPGFHDSHTHFLRGALSLTQVDLTGASDIQEIQRRLADYAVKNATAVWIIGRGWDQTSWAPGAYPTRADIDAVVSTRPVALADADGRALWLNTEGLKRARITSRTPRFNSGQFIKDDKGELTGLLLDEATSPAIAAIPAPSRAQKLDALRRALALARESGVTAVESLQGPFDALPSEQLDLWKELYKNGDATLRYFLYGRLEDPGGFSKLRKTVRDIPRDRLDLIGVKGLVDGTFKDRTAALLQPYFDANASGALKHQTFSLNSMIRRAHQDGLQVALHCVGDRAVRAALDACQKSQERARQEELVLPPYPCKLEHVEDVDAKDLPRFAGLHAVASMQPSRMIFDDEERNYYPNRLGSRVQRSFAWKSLEDAGALVSFGTDWPALPLAPRVGLFAAATRRHRNGKPEGGWIPAEKISLESAVAHYTADPARAIGRDDAMGRVKPGQLADLVVFDRDLFSTAGLDLLKVQVDMTIFDGKIVYERKP